MEQKAFIQAGGWGKKLLTKEGIVSGKAGLGGKSRRSKEDDLITLEVEGGGAAEGRSDREGS